MKTIKVSEATNIQLDWLVAKTVALEENQLSALRVEQGKPVLLWDGGEPRGPRRPCNYTNYWAQMGPIIEREKINTLYKPDINCSSGTVIPRWIASVVTHGAEGPTPLIAAARCYVASKLGETVEVPEELT